MEEKIEVLTKFWQETVDSSANFHKRGDEAVKFYIGAGTALAAWLLTSSSNFPLAAFAVLALGIFGAGHVAYYHNRGFRLQQRARKLAKRIAASAAVLDDLGLLWDASDDLNLRSFLTPGHPATQIFFNALIVLCLLFVYAIVLFYKQ